MVSIFFCFRQELLYGIFERITKPKLKRTLKYRCPRVIQNVSVVNRDNKACEEIMITKVKITLEQATKAQRGSNCIAALFLQPRR